MDKLSVEQEFELTKLAALAKHLSREQLEKNLIDVIRTMMMKEALYKKMLLESARIVTPIFEGKND